MSKKMEELRDMLCTELWKVSKKGEISSPAELEAIDKLTHSIKSIDTIMAMEESYGNEYSERNYDNGNSYARGRSRYAKRDSMGRYSRDRYSYEDGKEEILEHIDQMMNSNPDEHMRQAIRDFKYKIESM